MRLTHMRLMHIIAYIETNTASVLIGVQTKFSFAVMSEENQSSHHDLS